MTEREFDIKWAPFLEEGHYGLAIDHPKVIEYLDSEFTKEIKFNKEFTFSQIKLKFGSSRVYANSKNTAKWETEVDRLLKL